MRDLVNQMKTSRDPNYCQRVTADEGALGDQYLWDFRDDEKTIPTVLTTSQKLSTGVDARNIRNIVLMRRVNSMIEFKQIIGRGTRLYDGKDYFTIWDFVKAHHHFSDPEWDGEPLNPEVEPEPKEPEPVAPPFGLSQPPVSGSGPSPRPQKIKVTLADGKARTIQHMMATSFWHPDGTPMSAQQYMEMLFGTLPEFFKDEAELRSLWSAPDTRAKLLQGLAEKRFGKDQMAEMQRVIDAENSGLFDVLAHVAYALPPLTREERSAKAKIEISTHFNSEAAGLPGVRVAPLRAGRGRRTRSREIAPLAAAQISQRHRRRRRRSGPTRGDRKRLRRLSEISLSGCGLTSRGEIPENRAASGVAPVKLTKSHDIVAPLG